MDGQKPAKLRHECYVILCQVRGNYMDFSTIKLRRKRYVERALIFRSAKLHQKSTWK